MPEVSISQAGAPRTRVVRLLVVLVGFLAAGFGIATAAVAAASLPQAIQTYAYAGHHHTALTIDATTERAPPPMPGGATAAAVDDWSLASPRSDDGASSPVYDYDDSHQYVQVAPGVQTTQRAGGSRRAEHAVLTQPAAPAAETGSDLSAGYSSFNAAKRAMGSPGQGNVFDHVVEQSQIGRSGFEPQEIHNPFNMDPVSARTNQIKANYYSSKQPFTGGGTVRDWLTGLSFADQYSFGMDVLTQIRKGLSNDR
jgi:hypothetical protein